MTITIEDISTFCKKKGFVFQSAEIYGGSSGFFDYGPLGVELKNNIKNHWWKRFVQSRPDVVGIDGSLISNEKIWEASGHLTGFSDLLVECVKCGKNHRADHLVEDAIKKPMDGIEAEEINNLIKKHQIKCPNCKGDFKESKSFNLMFPVQVGADKTKDSTYYLRGETAQMIFSIYKNIIDTARVKLPFGIAQIGKAFRNEISPRDFIFRVREFEQMEIEFFIKPEETKCQFLESKHKNFKFNFLSESNQNQNVEEKEVKMSDLISDKLLGEWHAYWLTESFQWFLHIGIKKENLRIRQHMADELSHYSSVTFDIEYHYPLGWKEIHGNANRGQFDLKQHMEHSKKSMEIHDQETNTKMIPRVIEPSWGVERTFLTAIIDSYVDDEKRGNIVLKLNPKIAPIKLAVFPLVNKLNDNAKEVYDLLKEDFVSTFDKGGSVGRRYARADEQGIPYCITFDFDSLEDKSVTIRDRDTTEQIRVKIEDLTIKISNLLKGTEKFE